MTAEDTELLRWLQTQLLPGENVRVVEVHDSMYFEIPRRLANAFMIKLNHMARERWKLEQRTDWRKASPITCDIPEPTQWRS